MGILATILYFVLAASLGSNFFYDDFLMLMLSVTFASVLLTMAFYAILRQDWHKDFPEIAREALKSAALMLWLLLTLSAEFTKISISGNHRFELMVPMTFTSVLVTYVFLGDILNFRFKRPHDSWENWLRIFLICYFIVQYLTNLNQLDSGIILVVGIVISAIVTMFINRWWNPKKISGEPN